MSSSCLPRSESNPSSDHAQRRRKNSDWNPSAEHQQELRCTLFSWLLLILEGNKSHGQSCWGLLLYYTEEYYCTITIFLIYNITYLLKSRKEHEKDKLVYVSWLSIGVKTADVNDLSQRRAAARHTSSVLWAWLANRPTPASSLIAGLLRRGNETHCREAAADPLDTTSNLGAGLPEFALSRRGHPCDQG